MKRWKGASCSWSERAFLLAQAGWWEGWRGARCGEAWLRCVATAAVARRSAHIVPQRDSLHARRDDVEHEAAAEEGAARSPQAGIAGVAPRQPYALNDESADAGLAAHPVGQEPRADELSRAARLAAARLLRRCEVKPLLNALPLRLLPAAAAHAAACEPA